MNALETFSVKISERKREREKGSRKTVTYICSRCVGNYLNPIRI